MRLSEDHLARIRAAVAGTLSDGAEVWLFGSRMNDAMCGGDIDLYVELDAEPQEAPARQLKFYAALQRALGEQRIDIVVHRRGTAPRAIDKAARSHGVRL